MKKVIRADRAESWGNHIVWLWVGNPPTVSIEEVIVRPNACVYVTETCVRVVYYSNRNTFIL